jgi:hypothetical protein
MRAYLSSAPAGGIHVRWFAAFAGLAALSAFLCYLSVLFAPDLVSFSFARKSGVSILPGIIFGTLVAFCNHVFGGRGILRSALVVGLTTLGWVAAVDATVLTVDALSGSSQATQYLIGGLIGGGVGGALTLLGVAMTNRSYRRFEACAVSWAAATLAGATLGLLDLKEESDFLILFAVWQIAVIVALVRGFPRDAAKLGWKWPSSSG